MPKPTYQELEERVREQEKLLSDVNRADEKEKLSIKFLDTIIDMSPISMWVSDKDGTVIRTNHSLRESIGLTDDKIIGQYNVFKDRNLERAGVMTKVRSVYDNHEATRFSLFWKADLADAVDFKGAHDMYIDVSMFPILNAEGELNHVVCQWNDITDLKNTEDELRKNESLMQRVFEILPIGLWFADENGQLIKGNPAGIRIWGAEPKVGP